MKTKRLYLAGFMGSGKSTLGLILANKIGWDFFDLDKLIEAKFGMKVVDIFREFGEDEFRKAETDTLTEVSKHDDSVISLGGGTIAFGDNLKIVKKHGKLIYLSSSPEKILERLKFKTDRPLFQTTSNVNATREEAMAKIVSMLEKRKPYYSQADLEFSTDRMSVGRSVELLAKIIERKL